MFGSKIKKKKKKLKPKFIETNIIFKLPPEKDNVALRRPYHHLMEVEKW